MATTELDKIPETMLSRSQVYEFRTISTQGDRRSAPPHRRRRGHRRSATTSLQLIARDADGSMRDAQSKLDQVIAFTGQDDQRRRCRDGARAGRTRPAARHRCRPWRDEDAPAAFALAGRAVEMGYDLRAVCRELARVVRDLLVLSVDPSRVNDPEIAGEGERDRLQALAGAVLARGSAARVRSADARRGRHPRRRAAALSPRDGAAAVDLPAQARADRRSDRRRARAPARPAAASRVVAGARRRASKSRRWRARAAAPGSRAPAAPVVSSRRLVTPSRLSRSAASADVRRHAGRRPASRTRCSRRSASEGRVLQHGRRAGAEDRGRRRPRDVHVLGRASARSRDQFEQNRAWLESAGAAGRPGGRSP